MAAATQVRECFAQLKDALKTTRHTASSLNYKNLHEFVICIAPLGLSDWPEARDAASLSAVIAVALEHGAVDNVSCMFSRIVDVHKRAVAAGLLSASDGTLPSISGRFLSVFEWLSKDATALVKATISGDGPVPAATAARRLAATRLLTQLCSDTAVSAAAAAVRFSRYLRSTGPGGWSSPGPGRVPERERPETAALQAVLRSAIASLDSDLLPAGNIHTACCYLCHVTEGLVACRGDDRAASAAAAQLAAALRSSGLLDELCAAVLDAPPCPPVPSDPTGLSMRTGIFAETHVLLVRFMKSLASVDVPQLRAAAPQLLSTAAAQRLRWALLEQLAASAPAAADGAGGERNVNVPAGPAAAAGGPQSKGGGGRDGSGSGSGSGHPVGSTAGGTAAGTRLWPLLHPSVLRFLFDNGVALKEVLHALVSVAVYGQELPCSPSPPQAAASQQAHRAGGAAAPRRSRAEAVALAARAAQALSWHDGDGGGSGAVAPPLADCGHRLWLAVNALVHSAPATEAAAFAPDLFALQAWQLRLLAVAPEGWAAETGASFDEYVSRSLQFTASLVQLPPWTSTRADVRK
ncbi:hypothetical protein GPECTOR_3g173 [Gonium pectorale]|uniref:Uncharacterized protein n=1 Tax=Gonium pectorale TaxID=33097 RepID=A0A150H0B6_GONPE|nr:hypothetical protein GPECTOR_3g173 [Gonium pectorale]|eukprot:KXZ55010.1 hypothetical protein GPECTOR_3g173 [Gonium pectorale]